MGNRDLDDQEQWEYIQEWKKRMYKITGTLNVLCWSKEGSWIEIKKTVYAKYKWTMKMKVFFMKIFYDWVEVEEGEVK